VNADDTEPVEGKDTFPKVVAHAQEEPKVIQVDDKPKSFYEQIWEKNNPEEVKKAQLEAQKKAMADKVKKMQDEAKRLA